VLGNKLVGVRNTNDVLRDGERGRQLNGRFVILQAKFSLKYLAERQVMGLVRVAEADDASGRGGDGPDVILRIQPKLVDQQQGIIDWQVKNGMLGIG